MVLLFRRKYLGLALVLIMSLALGYLIIKLLYPYQHSDIISREADYYGLDPLFVAAVINTESHFRSEVESPKGAVGLMQIMPDTAKWIAEQQGISKFKQEDLLKPETNIAFGTWYLANLTKEFNSPVKVLAAYNGGRGNVKEWLEKGVWSGDEEDLEQIPFEETQNYVKKVLRSYRVYHIIY